MLNPERSEEFNISRIMESETPKVLDAANNVKISAILAYENAIAHIDEQLIFAEDSASIERKRKIRNYLHGASMTARSVEV